MKNKTVVFTGGGTGGHIYPGLAVADSLREIYDGQIVWLGSSRGMDRNLVEKSGICDKFIGIPSGKLRRYFSLKNISDIFRIIAGCISSFFILLKLKPQLLFSKGGFVSVPPCFAAKLLHIPVYTHECDFSPGLATKLNSKSATKILLTYEETASFLSESAKKKVIVTGNPVRSVFYTAKAQDGLDFLGIAKTEKPVLFVLGGSGGAKQINDIIIENLEWLCEHYIVVHQTGISAENSMLQTEQNSLVERLKAEKKYLPYQFIYNEMPSVQACCDVIFSRAGANTLWEAIATEKPLVLLPLAGSGTRGDQVENAAFLEKQGAAIVIKNGQGESEAAKAALEKLLDKNTRAQYSEAIKKLKGDKQASKVIAQIIFNNIIKQD